MTLLPISNGDLLTGELCKMQFFFAYLTGVAVPAVKMVLHSDSGPDLHCSLRARFYDYTSGLVARGEGDRGNHLQGCQMAKFDPFLSLDCARVEGVGAQSKESKEGIKFCSVA